MKNKVWLYINKVGHSDKIVLGLKTCWWHLLELYRKFDEIELKDINSVKLIYTYILYIKSISITMRTENTQSYCLSSSWHSL